MVIVQPSDTNWLTRSAVASTSPVEGPHPVALIVGASNVSAGAVTAIARIACVRDIMRSASKCSRGNVLFGSLAHVEASARARSSSSAMRSCARSRSRRWSSRTSSLRSPSVSAIKSVRSTSSLTSHGSQLSMPSNVAPSASRSHCSRPHGSVASKLVARWRTMSSACNSRAGKMVIDPRSSVLRWSLTLNVVSRSTSSPHRSMRTGASKVDGKMSMIEPRRATSPRCSTNSSRR